MSEFDEYASRYEALVGSAVKAQDIDYYQLRKIEVIRDIVKGSPESILDFGAGVGGLTSHLVREFNFSRIFAEDVSSESLRVLSERLPSVVVCSSQTSGIKFDLIVVSNVLHHIEQNEREVVLESLRSRLAPGGTLIVIEHNRLNPLTRRAVSRCEFDQGVKLVKKRNLVKWAKSLHPFDEIKSGYLIFFPPLLAGIRSFEKLLIRVPVGAQFVFCLTLR